MQNPIIYLSEHLAPGYRLAVYTVVGIVLLLLVSRLLVLLVRGIASLFDMLSLNILMARIRNCKNIDDRVLLIDTYNNRIHHLSEREKPRMPKPIKLIITLIVLAALVICTLAIVKPDISVSREAFKALDMFEKRLTPSATTAVDVSGEDTSEVDAPAEDAPAAEPADSAAPGFDMTVKSEAMDPATDREDVQPRVENSAEPGGTPVVQ